MILPRRFWLLAATGHATGHFSLAFWQEGLIFVSMIAAATHANSSIVDTINNLPFNWFDVVVLAVLFFGVFRGRKNGMTKEVIPLLEWLAVVIAGGFGYMVAAQIYINALAWKQSVSDVLGYLTVAVLVFFVFLVPRKFLMPRLEGSNVFGSGEYYVGMLSGLVRYACIVIFFLALLNAPVYTAADIAATKAYNNRWFGGGMQGYSGDFIPDMNTVQEIIFKKSFVGPLIKQNLDMLLVNTGGAEPASAPKPKRAIINIQP